MLYFNFLQSKMLKYTTWFIIFALDKHSSLAMYVLVYILESFFGNFYLVSLVVYFRLI